MKQLNAADLELLAKRGKIVNGFTTTRSTVVRTAADRFKDFNFDAPKPKKVKKVKKAKVNHPLVGRMIHGSWGYNMTINEFAKILEVSPTGKTAVCRMLVKKGFNGFQGDVEAGKEVYGPKFRVKISEYSHGTSFHGSYPFIVNEADYNSDEFVGKTSCSTRMGYFGLHNGGKVWENHMD